MLLSLLLVSAPVLLVVADAILPSALLFSPSSPLSLRTISVQFSNYDFRYSLIDIPLISLIRSAVILCVYSLCDGPKLSRGPYLSTAAVFSVSSLLFVSLKASYVFSNSSSWRREGGDYAGSMEVALFGCSLALAIGHAVVAYWTSCRERRKLLVYRIDIEAGLDVVKQQVKASQHEQVVERKARPRPQKEHALNCPRCHSTNTKFCYYNNYSLSQPRYFCKTCRRYWTEGGTISNVPVGGGSRKNKRSTTCTSPSLSPSSMMKRKLPDPTTFQNPRIRDGHLEDLSLGYGGRNHHHPKNTENHVYNNSLSCGLIPMFFGEGKSVEFDENPNNLPSSSSSICHFMPAGNSPSIGFSFLGSTMQLTTNANNVINADHPYFKLQSLDGGHGHLNHHIGYGNARAIQEGVFQTRFSHHPYEEEPSNYKPFTTSVAADHHRYELEQNKGQLGESSSGYWGTGMLGGGSW